MTNTSRNLSTAILSLLLVSSIQAESISPSEQQPQVLSDMLEILHEGHYRDRTIDDTFSQELFEAYLDDLDPSKSYFLQSDIDGLATWKTKLDDQLKDRDPAFGFKAFNLYRDIAAKQLDHNIALLEGDFVFNFEDDEILSIDLDDMHWPKTVAERNDLWRKRMEDSLLRLMLSDKDTAEAREVLAKRYKTIKQQLEELNTTDVFQTYANAISSLYDPHTNYFSPRTSENFNINMSLSLEGIGAVLQREEEYIEVVSIVPGGPADKQGELKAGDRIVGIATGEDGENVDIVGWRLDDAVDLIRGPKSSLAVLQVLPAGTNDATVTIKIVRDKVKLEEQAAKSDIIEIARGDNNYRIGVIDIPTFYRDFEADRNGDNNVKSTTRDVYNLLNEFSKQNIDGVIVDLRSNGGGALQEATMLSDLFINPGPVVQIKNSKGRINRRQVARSGAYYRGPLIVLIDRLSASASEIFAGAMQDYNRAVIVGSQSFGKGTVQVLLPLSEGQLKLTESKFYRVSGDSNQHHGITPDIKLPSLMPEDSYGESNEKNALPWDQIRPANYRKNGDLSTVIPILDKYHQDRISSDPGFTEFVKALKAQDDYRKEQASAVTLSKGKRLEQREKVKELDLALENSRRKALGKESFPDYSTWQEARRDEEISSESDLYLMETCQIMADMIQLRNHQRLAETP